VSNNPEVLGQPESTVATEIVFYLIDVVGCTDPSVVGPFDTEEERDEAARSLRADQDDEDALFWLDVRDGVPVTGAYMAGFFED
jgi:hypothetical protein